MQAFTSSKGIKSALLQIYTLLLVAFVLAFLYIGRVILMPLSLSILLAFLFSPFVSKLEAWIGRFLAVILTVLFVTVAMGFTGYVLSKEFIRFASNLPVYKTNINAKLSSLQNFQETLFIQPSATFNDLKNKLSGDQSTKEPNQSGLVSNQVLLHIVEWVFGSTISVLTTIFLVILLGSFILAERKELHGRIIKLIGPHRIGPTTHAIDDASKRVSRYLRMLLLINISYGLVVTIGLYFLGIPNAILWGALSAILRFVPYVGPWIAAAIPIALSFAITSNWLGPLLTVSLFVVLEAVAGNIFEPLLYGASTGVSATALIIAALFWTMLWGPIGLILSTPITVCLVVLGRHVPRLEFLSILLSDEEPLALHEEYYHRFLVSNVDEVSQLTDNFLKDKPLTALYDTVLIPTIITAEKDRRNETLDEDQLNLLESNLEDMIEDINNKKNEQERKILTQLNDQETDPNQINKLTKNNIVCLPAKAKRDELVGVMLSQLLKQENAEVQTPSSQLKIDEMIEYVKTLDARTIIISVVPPSTIIQARFLTRKIRSAFPKIKIIVGLWGYTDNLGEVAEGLYSSGADGVVSSLEDATSLLKSDPL